MAELVIQTKKIKDNIIKLSEFFEKHDIHWSLVTKVFSGDKVFLKHILTEEVIEKISSVGDSRLASLKNLKAINPAMKTIYIKPPAQTYADEIVEFADTSLNSSLNTIKALNEAAKKQEKTHQIIIMIELGELREGVIGSDIEELFQEVLALPHINVVGLGSNLGCMYGIEPSYDKLIQLTQYKDLIAKKFNKELPYLSGGTSITLPLIENKTVPKGINHYRIGEAAFFGLTPLNNAQFSNLSTDTFEFSTHIIELEEKQLVPEGVIGEAQVGKAAAFSEDNLGKTSIKAILDFGQIDVDQENIEPIDKDIEFVGVTSDMAVVDLGTNRGPDGKKKYSSGDQIKFKPNYMAVARLLNSKFIVKEFV